MNANQTRRIGQNIKNLLPEGSTVQLVDRQTGEPAGQLEIQAVTHQEVRGIWHGRTTSFRVPALTQRGGNTRIVLPEAISA